LTLTVEGANFAIGDSVVWTNGTLQTLLSTTYVDSTTLTAELPEALLVAADAGTATVEVEYGSSLLSSALPFTVQTGAATTTGLTPSTVVVDSGAITLAINGTDYVDGDTVYWQTSGGTAVPLTTTFLDSTTLTAVVPAGLLTSIETAEVTVVDTDGNSSPAGTVSVESASTIAAQTGGVGSVFPSVNFEDLGLVLKVTPHVHDGEAVTLEIEAEYKELTGKTSSNMPIISNRKYTGTLRVRFGEAVIIAGLGQRTISTTRSGIPGLTWIPWLHSATDSRDRKQLLLVVRPELLRLPPSESVTHAIWSGTEVRPLPLDFYQRSVAPAGH
jgi:hypothetical protein